MIARKRLLASLGVLAAVVLATAAFYPAAPLFSEAPDGFSRDVRRDWRFIESWPQTFARAQVKGDTMTVFLADSAPGLAYQGVIDKDWKDAAGGDFEVDVDAHDATHSNRFEMKFKLTHDHHREFLGFTVSGDGRLEMVQVSGGERTETQAMIDRDLDHYWRIRHEPATDEIVWLTSRDGRNWTERGRQPRRLDLTKTKIEAYAGTFLPVDHPGVVVFRGCC